MYRHRYRYLEYLIVAFKIFFYFRFIKKGVDVCEQFLHILLFSGLTVLSLFVGSSHQAGGDCMCKLFKSLHYVEIQYTRTSTKGSALS